MRRKWFSPRALLWHLLLITIVPGCLLAGWWQVHRAMSGNLLSYGYSIEWPAFAIIAVIGWWQLIQEDPADVEERKEERWRLTHPTPGRAVDLLLGEIAAHPEVLDAFPDLKRAYPELVRAHPELVLAHPELPAAEGGLAADVLRADVLRAGGVESGAVGSGAVATGAVESGAVESGAVGSGDVGSGDVDLRHAPAPSDDLRSYNDYLAGLARGGKPKTWRNPYGQ